MFIYPFIYEDLNFKIDLPVGMSNWVMCKAAWVSVTIITELKKSLKHHDEHHYQQSRGCRYKIRNIA